MNYHIAYFDAHITQTNNFQLAEYKKEFNYFTQRHILRALAELSSEFEQWWEDNTGVILGIW